MEGKKRRSLSVSKGKQQKTVESGSACAREEGEASLAVGPVPHSLEQQQASIFIPSNLCSQDSSPSQIANPSQAKGQAPDTPSSSLGKRRKVPVQRLGEVDNFEKELEFALRLSAAEANHNLKRTPSRKHPPQSDGVVTDAGATVGQAQHDLSLEVKAQAAHASSSSLGEFPAEVAALEHSEGPTNAAEKVHSVTPAAKGKTAETPAAMTSDDVSARKTKKKRRVIQSEDEDDIKKSPSKHTLAPTDPLQAEADSIPDSEDESAKRIECVVGAGLNKESATGEKEPASKRCRLQQDSSEDEVESSTTLERSDPKNAHPAKCAPHVQAAQGGWKKKKASSDDDENSEDKEYSEAEESDDDFESEEDEDFKGKRGKKGKGKIDKDAKKGKGKSQKDSQMAAAVATATGVGGTSNALIRGRQAPPAIEPPPISKNGGKKTRAEKEIEKLAFQNPGVKAAVVKVRGAKTCVPPTPQITVAAVHQDNAAFSGSSVPENHQNLPKNVAAAANSKDKDTNTLPSSTTSSEVQSSTTLERSDPKNAHPAKCAPHVQAAQGGGKKKKASSDDDENSEDKEYSEAEESDDDFESEEDEDSKDQKGKKGKGKSDKDSEKGKGKSQKDSRSANSMTSRPISAISTAAPEVAARPGTSIAAVGGSKAGANRVAPSAHLPPPSAAHSGCVCSGGPTLASRPPRVGLVRFGPVTSLHGAAGGRSALESASTGSGLKITGGQQGVRRPGLQKNVKVHQQLHQRYD